jgi:hypothetical protein
MGPWPCSHVAQVLWFPELPLPPVLLQLVSLGRLPRPSVEAMTANPCWRVRRCRPVPLLYRHALLSWRNEFAAAGFEAGMDVAGIVPPRAEHCSLTPPEAQETEVAQQELPVLPCDHLPLPGRMGCVGIMLRLCHGHGAPAAYCRQEQHGAMWRKGNHGHAYRHPFGRWHVPAAAAPRTRKPPAHTSITRQRLGCVGGGGGCLPLLLHMLLLLLLISLPLLLLRDRWR